VCDDGNACNGLEQCSPLVGCQAGQTLACDDGNLCNGAEYCDPALGCRPGQEDPCDDGNSCNGRELCQPGIGCQAGVPPTVCDGQTAACDFCRPAQCGDHVVGGLEQCDEAPRVCAYGNSACVSCQECQLRPTAWCGDGVVNGPLGAEECEPPTASATCAYGSSCQVCGANCHFQAVTGPYCGDGVVNGPEACDGGPQCTSTCTREVAQPVCGNGTAEGNEGCDDGNTVTEVCPYGVSSCQVCNASCQLATVTGPYCGDGVVNGSEECEGELCTNCRRTNADRCEICLRNAPDPDFRAANEQLCNSDPLCVNVKRCLLNDASDPNNAGRSCFNAIPAMCYCGITTDFTSCQFNPNFVAAGPCAAETIAGIPDATTPQQVFERITLFEYPTGKAYQIVDFARQVCKAECGFTRGD
jgi:hypothetical protein